MKKSHAVKRPINPNSRKALRKQKRKEKKVHRKEHYLKKKSKIETSTFTPGRFVKRPADAVDFSIEIKKKKPKLDTAQGIIERQRKKEQTDTQRLQSQMDDQRKKLLLDANEDEDKVIKKLEKQLGLNKSKNKNNYFAEDGLDYLLEICDRSTSEQIVAAEKHLANVENESDFEDDLAAVTGKEIKDKKKSKLKKNDFTTKSDESNSETDDDDDDNEGNLSGEIFGSDNMDSEYDDDSDVPDDNDKPEEKTKKSNIKMNESKITKKEKVIKEDDISKVFSDDEVSHLSGDDEDLEGFSADEGDEVVEDKEEKPDVWEDIYGRKRDKEGNIIKEVKGVYIPPHLRNKDSSSDKDLIQLKRQVKSVINKLSGMNLHWASNSIESLYSNHSRHSVNSSLLEIFVDATIGTSSTADRMLSEMAALVGVLHANVGSEVGAHFLEVLSKKFDVMMQEPQPVENKTLDNLVACLAHLYNFKIYQAQLLYDILQRLLQSLTEKTIECILVVLRTVGGVLRKEEPVMLKEFIQNAQSEGSKFNGDAGSGSRIKFLLEVLLAVKNNNLTKIPNYDPSYTEELKKQIRGIIRKGNYVTTLNIRLDDLLKVEERGKWWVVGSAWEGNRQLPTTETNTPLPTNDHKLLQLARAQRMNTDVRRNIFCVIMSAETKKASAQLDVAESIPQHWYSADALNVVSIVFKTHTSIQDYMDAFEKLQHLGLKGQQEREIVHVTLTCCLQEKAYNPYYAVLGQKLCDVDRKYQLSIQYSVWDKIKEIEELPKHNVTNLAQFLTHLILNKGLPISVLKVIQFSDLNKHTVKFMRQILLSIIMNEDLQESLEVFHRIAKPPKLHMFRESLRLFIQHFLVKNAGKKVSVLSEDELLTLKNRALEVEKILTMFENKLRL